MAKSGDQLLASVRTSVTMPNNQVLLTDERILQFANEEQADRVMPLLVALRQEYFVKLEVEATVQGKENYAIPYRSIGRTMRDLKVSSNGVNTQTWNVPQIAMEDEHLYRNGGSFNGFYFRGDEIILVSAPNSSDMLLQKWYLLRPNEIVASTAAAKIVGIAGNVLTCQSVPSTIVDGSIIDIIQGRQGNSTLQMDAVVSSVVGQQITLATPLPILSPFVTVGDWVALAEQSPLIQLPDEAFPLLSALTQVRALEAVGDFEGKQAVEAGIPEKRRLFEMILAPRMEGENQKVIQRNGLLRGNRGLFRRGIIY